MAQGKLLRKLIKAGASGDADRFREVSEEVIRHERRKQHHLLANDLERILYGAPQLVDAATRLSDEIPTDPERSLPLLSLREPVRSLDDLVLEPAMKDSIEHVLREHHRADEIKSYGLRPARRLLFYGPPGCGKTMTAEAMGYELSRVLAVIRLDSVVSSFLGDTAMNLRRVFEFLSRVPVVAVFDEFDALGKSRTDPTEHGEVRRVVNAVLQMMDDYRGESILIATTNHERLLDPAIWRRFEEVFLFPLPTTEQMVTFVERRMATVRREFEVDDIPVAEWFTGWSYADVERVVLRAVKFMIVAGEEFLRRSHLEKALALEQTRRAATHGST